MDLKLWTSSYGPQAMDLKLWTSSYGPQAMDLKLWTSSYGPQAMDLKLWTSSYGPQAMDLKLYIIIIMEVSSHDRTRKCPDIWKCPHMIWPKDKAMEVCRHLIPSHDMDN